MAPLSTAKEISRMTNEERFKLFRDVVANGARMYIMYPGKILKDISAEVSAEAKEITQALLDEFDDALIKFRNYFKAQNCWHEDPVDQQPNEAPPPEPSEPEKNSE